MDSLVEIDKCVLVSFVSSFDVNIEKCRLEKRKHIKCPVEGASEFLKFFL